MTDIIGPLEWFIFVVALLLLGGELSFGYWLYRRWTASKFPAFVLLVAFGVGTGAFTLFYFFAVTIYAFSFMDCCYGGTTPSIALAQRIDYSALPMEPFVVVPVFFALILLG